MKREQIEIGFIDIPVRYPTFSKRKKNIVCDNLIDNLLTYIDKELESLPHINRITFLDEILESSLQSNVDLELYEVAQVIFDCKKRLNEA